jgi:hypothetical protein
MPKTPSRRPIDRYCVQCEALVLFSDWAACKYCGGRLTANKPLRGALSRASTLKQKQRAALDQSSGSGVKPIKPPPRTAVVVRAPGNSHSPYCEICGNLAKKNTKRCRPCEGKTKVAKSSQAKGAPQQASRKQRAAARNTAQQSKTKREIRAAGRCECCGLNAKTGLQYCARCTELLRPGARAMAVQTVPAPRKQPRSGRRTTGQIKTRTYTPPENDPRITNDYAKGMRGRPAGEFGD